MNTKTTYPGIDYSGPGSSVNRDPQTRIRYGIISRNSVIECGREVYEQGKNISFQNFHDTVRASLVSALDDYFSRSELDEAVSDAFEAIEDSLNDRYEEDNDKYLYEKDGYLIETCMDNDFFVLKSPFFTYAQFCSPCVPGACNLDSPLEEPNEPNKCYCLGPDWFDSDSPCPYPVYSVETGKIIDPV